SGKQHDAQQFLANGKGLEFHGHSFTTLDAAASISALIFRCAASTGARATWKRRRSLATTKLTMLPNAWASSESVTVNTGLAFKAAKTSSNLFRSRRPRNSTWMPARELSRGS